MSPGIDRQRSILFSAMIRLHVPQPLSPGAPLAPTLDQSRYLTQVMRLRAGDALLVFNGADGEWRASVAEVLKKGVILRAEEQVRPQTSSPDVELILAVIKKGPLEFAVEKATELGVSRIRLIRTRRTTTEHLRLDRLDAIAIESAEQCGRLDVPVVDDPVRLDDLLDGWGSARHLILCDEALEPGATQPLPPGPAAVLIGPEGGFAPEERDRLAALPFVHRISLGPRILRADTAAVAALTLWQTQAGDWA